MKAPSNGPWLGLIDTGTAVVAQATPAWTLLIPVIVVATLTIIVPAIMRTRQNDSQVDSGRQSIIVRLFTAGVRRNPSRGPKKVDRRWKRGGNDLDGFPNPDS